MSKSRQFLWQFGLTFSLVCWLSLGFGQKTFQIQSTVGSGVILRVNGLQYRVDSSFTSIATRYPEFDTLQFSNGPNPDRQILANFKPDSVYSIIPACCASLDIVPDKELKHDSLSIWDLETDYEKTKGILMDHPHITFRIENGNVRDSIYGWYADHACFPQFKIIDSEGWEYGSPVKCFYWTNISPFIFFKSNEDYSGNIDADGVIENEYPENPEILGRVYVRLFDDQRYVIAYDVESQEVHISYESK